MEDIRFDKEKERKKLDKSIKLTKFIGKIKKNWWKILLVILIMFIIIFPGVTGNLLGSWWNSFATSFLQKLTF